MNGVLIIADTHGYLSDKLLGALMEMGSIKIGCPIDHVLHAGDVAGRGPLRPEQIITKLQSIAPTTVVRGNTDDQTFPARVCFNCGGRNFIVEHGHHFQARPQPSRHNQDIIKRLKANHGDILVTGHSHMAEFFFENGIYFLNPGSAGPRRFNLAGQRCALLRLNQADASITAWRVQIEKGDTISWTLWPLESHTKRPLLSSISPSTAEVKLTSETDKKIVRRTKRKRASLITIPQTPQLPERAESSVYII